MQMLLDVPSTEVGPRLEALGTALGIPPGEVLLLVQDEPHFLLFSKWGYAEGWEALQRICQGWPEWRPQQIGSWTGTALYRYVFAF
jgi:hypothetical protein